jgi:hypothetical protein
MSNLNDLPSVVVYIKRRFKTVLRPATRTPASGAYSYGEASYAVASRREKILVFRGRLKPHPLYRALFNYELRITNYELFLYPDFKEI